jgi:hypothetical protein
MSSAGPLRASSISSELPSTLVQVAAGGYSERRASPYAGISEGNSETSSTVHKEITMALSTCPKPGCGSHIFEVVGAEPHNSRFKLLFVQCIACGTVVGTQPYRNTNSLIGDLQKQVKDIQNDVRHIKSVLKS